MNINKILSSIGIGAGAIILGLGIQYAVADWTSAPVSGPPNDNVAAPINVGGGTAGNTYVQTKTGTLVLNDLVVKGLQVLTAAGTTTTTAGSVLTALNNDGLVGWVQAGGSGKTIICGTRISNTVAGWNGRAWASGECQNKQSGQPEFPTSGCYGSIKTYGSNEGGGATQFLAINPGEIGGQGFLNGTSFPDGAFGIWSTIGGQAAEISETYICGGSGATASGGVGPTGPQGPAGPAGPTVGLAVYGGCSSYNNGGYGTMGHTAGYSQWGAASFSNYQCTCHSGSSKVISQSPTFGSWLCTDGTETAGGTGF